MDETEESALRSLKLFVHGCSWQLTRDLGDVSFSLDEEDYKGTLETLEVAGRRIQFMIEAVRERLERPTLTQ